MDPRAMSTAELEAMAMGTAPEADADEATDTTEPETVDAGAVTDADPPAEQQADPKAQDPNWKPEGPGDLKVALQQERDKLKRIEAERETERQELQQHRDTLRQQQAERERQAAQQQQDQIRQQLSERLAYVDGDEAARVAMDLANHQAQQTNQGQQQRQTLQHLATSAQMAREFLPDFDAHLKTAYEQFGPALDQWALAKNPANPAKAAYELGKSLSAGADVEATISAEVEKRLAAKVAEVLQKQKPPDTQGHKTIGHIASQAPSAPVNFDVNNIRKMSTKDIERRAMGR